jgi:glycosyltransferase involved in cell wall biosynthesis
LNVKHGCWKDTLCLAAEGVFARTAEIAKWLVHEQKDGFWPHEAVPGKVPSWGIMECVVGLSRFLTETGNTTVDQGHMIPRTAQILDGILAIATEWNSKHGGLSTFNRELCMGLARNGQRVVCLVPKADHDEIDSAAKASVELITAPFTGVHATEDSLFRRPKLPKGFNPRIVIGHGRITGEYSAAQVSDNFTEALRVHFVHMIPDEIEWHKEKSEAAAMAELRMRQELLLCQGSSLVVAVGPRIHREVATLLHGLQSPPLVHRFDPGLSEASGSDSIPPGIQCLVLGRAEDLILKGIDIATRAVAGLPHPDPRPFESEPILVVRGAPAGTGAELRQSLIKFAGKAMDIRVKEFTSKVEHINEDLRRASVVLMPSRAEGFGLVATEALSLRRPILVSDRSGFGELLVEKLGKANATKYVVRTTGDLDLDGEEWSRALEATLRDRKAAFRRSQELHEKLSKVLSWDAAAAALLVACESIGLKVAKQL